MQCQLSKSMPKTILQCYAALNVKNLAYAILGVKPMPNLAFVSYRFICRLPLLTSNNTVTFRLFKKIKNKNFSFISFKAKNLLTLCIGAHNTATYRTPSFSYLFVPNMTLTLAFASETV